MQIYGKNGAYGREDGGAYSGGRRTLYGRNGRAQPIVTWLLLAANILYFLFLEWNGSTQDGYFMARHGTLVAAFVQEDGEWYRLFTSFFMHFGFSHLFNNMLLLWYLGMLLEKHMGHWRFAATYLASGLGANFLSLIYYLKTSPYANCAGASGAVFGVVGAMLWIVLRHRGQLEGLTSRRLLLMIFFSLYTGLTSIGINNTAHISGLAIGYVCGMSFYHGGAAVGPWLRAKLRPRS